MLTIYNIDRPNDAKIDMDVNAQFVVRGKIYDDDVTRRILKKNIERAQYLSSSEFIDRFGYKLHASNL